VTLLFICLSFCLSVSSITLTEVLTDFNRANGRHGLGNERPYTSDYILVMIRIRIWITFPGWELPGRGWGFNPHLMP